jgi:cell division protein FtsI (penicillin-binding protein 3)
MRKMSGLERTYDTLLKGESGRRLVRYIAGGTYIPVEGYEIESQNGKDIVTTLDVNIQDIAENALLKEMIANKAEHGTCIVMEVATGKIKAIANLGLQTDSLLGRPELFHPRHGTRIDFQTGYHAVPAGRQKDLR